MLGSLQSSNDKLTDMYNPSYNLKFLPRLSIAPIILNVNPRSNLNEVFTVDPNEHSKVLVSL